LFRQSKEFLAKQEIPYNMTEITAFLGMIFKIISG
jgi:hypothetical protein